MSLETCKYLYYLNVNIIVQNRIVRSFHMSLSQHYKTFTVMRRISNYILVFSVTHSMSHNIMDICWSHLLKATSFLHFSLLLYLALFFFIALFISRDIIYWLIYVRFICLFSLKYKLCEKWWLVFSLVSSRPWKVPDT